MAHTTENNNKNEQVVKISEKKQRESTQNTVNNPKGAGTATRVFGRMQTQTIQLMKYSVR